MKIENLCICYANEFHLGIILMEYFKRNSIKHNEVVTYFEDSITDQIKAIKKRYNTKQLSNINFEKSEIPNKLLLKDEKIIIINGSEKYIKSIKNKINELKDTENLKVISCYNFDQQLKNMNVIIEENEKIILTNEEISTNLAS